MIKRQKIKVVGKLTALDNERLKLAVPENYEKVIWNSIANYNYTAQLDVAIILRQKLEELPKSKENDSLTKNLGLRILQLYLETADQFALVCMSILAKHSRPVFETYLESENIFTRAFFKRCATGELSDSETEKIWGLNAAKNIKIQDKERRDRLLYLVKDIVTREKSNMKQFGSTYSKYDEVSGSVSYTSTVKGVTAIKHAFKMVHPSDLSRKIWQIDENVPTVMQEIRNLDFGKGKVNTSIVLGSMFDDASETLKDACDHLIRLIEFLSEQIRTIATIQENLPDNPFFTIALLSKDLKLQRNEKCFCGSGKKYKKCHYLT